MITANKSHKYKMDFFEVSYIFKEDNDYCSLDLNTSDLFVCYQLCRS